MGSPQQKILRSAGLDDHRLIIYSHGTEFDRDGLDGYAPFSPNGIVPSRGPAPLLHGNMPVLRHGHDVNERDPNAAARHVVDRIKQRRREGHPPFHWFRNILKRPTWYVDVVDGIETLRPSVELLDAPTFFELYRIHLENEQARP